jgi:hypothetical protein
MSRSALLRSATTEARQRAHDVHRRVSSSIVPACVRALDATHVRAVWSETEHAACDLRSLGDGSRRIVLWRLSAERGQLATGSNEAMT